MLLSPLARRNYRDGRLVAVDGLNEYAEAAKEVATEEQVTFVDLYQMSKQYLGRQTQEEAESLSLAPKPGTKEPNEMALNQAVAALFGRIIADNVIRTEVELGPNVIGLPDGTGPAMPKQAAPTDGR